jgi:hypothetical protein
MERVFRLIADLACVDEPDTLPAGCLILEPRKVASDVHGTDYAFLASLDGGQTWREFATVVDSAPEWFEPLAPADEVLPVSKETRARPPGEGQRRAAAAWNTP